MQQKCVRKTEEKLIHNVQTRRPFTNTLPPEVAAVIACLHKYALFKYSCKAFDMDMQLNVYCSLVLQRYMCNVNVISFLVA